MDGSLAYCPKQQAEVLTAALPQFPPRPPRSPMRRTKCCPLCSRTPHVRQYMSSESAGDAVVAVSEVRLALHSLPSHRAPGEDGLPLELWRLADGAWTPALARLYSAMFQLQRTPCRFASRPCTKAAPCARPAIIAPSRCSTATTRCWPACLLSTSARSCLPASAWSKRLTCPAGKAQLVAANLSLLGQCGAVVLLDIATIDRAFLLATIEHCGGGPGMRRWMHLLLQHTPASVVVRGRAAASVLWLAGVRQGCPLYLYVVEASARKLRAVCALGIMLAGRRIVSSHHADDTKVARALLRTGVFGSS
jgi:hypothetical protein